LLAQGKHLEMERDPATQEVGQGGEQRSKYRFHTGNATWAPTEKSTKSMSTAFLVGTRDGATPVHSGENNIVDINRYRWKQHCRGLFELPIAA